MQVLRSRWPRLSLDYILSIQVVYIHTNKYTTFHFHLQSLHTLNIKVIGRFLMTNKLYRILSAPTNFKLMKRANAKDIFRP